MTMRSIILPTPAVRSLLDNGECQHKVPVKVPKWLQAMKPVMDEAWATEIYAVTPGLKVPCLQFPNGEPDQIIERLRNPWGGAVNRNGVLVDGDSEGDVRIRLAVRETWRVSNIGWQCGTCDLLAPFTDVTFRADGWTQDIECSPAFYRSEEARMEAEEAAHKRPSLDRWRSPAVMPRAFSRLTVELTGVWAKRAPREETQTISAWDWNLTLKRVEA